MATNAPRPPSQTEIVFLATSDPAAPAAEALRAGLAKLCPTISDQARYAELRDRIWGIVTWGANDLPEWIAQHGAPPRLQWLHQSGVGMETMRNAPLPRETIVTNIKGNVYYGAPMAEHVVARMLEWAKELPRLREQQAARQWLKFEPFSLAGKTAMIFGYGTIGQEVAKRLKAFDMNIVIVRRGSRNGSEQDAAVMDLHEARQRIGIADYVVLTLPLTTETEGCIGAAELARMKPTAFIVNVGRAALIDEAALHDALHDDRIGGVALDVFWREPLAETDLVWAWPRVAITPHMSANVAGGNLSVIAETAVTTLRRILAGETPPNRVDLAIGY